MTSPKASLEPSGPFKSLQQLMLPIGDFSTSKYAFTTGWFLLYL
jgi:hypothetical protein